MAHLEDNAVELTASRLTYLHQILEDHHQFVVDGAANATIVELDAVTVTEINRL